MCVGHKFLLQLRGYQYCSGTEISCNNVVDTITFNWSNEGRTFLLKAEYLSFVNLETIGSQISYFDLKWVTFMVLSYY